MAVGQGDWERAETLFEESLALYREIRDVQGMGICLTNLGLASVASGDHARATDLFRENLRVVSESDKAALLHNFVGLACATAAQGQPVRAARLWGTAEAIQEGSDLRITPMTHYRINHDQHLNTARAQLGEAAFAAAWAEGKAMTQGEAVSYGLETAVQKGEPQRALSRREREVATLIARGLSNREIAAQLSISGRTVETHARNILGKLGLNSRAQLAARAAGTSPR